MHLKTILNCVLEIQIVRVWCGAGWTAGYSYYHLGEGTSDYNTKIRGGAVRDFDNHGHVFSGGLVVVL